MLSIKIDDCSVECPKGYTILKAADKAGIYIPRLCHHPDLPPVDEIVWKDRIFQGDICITGDKSSDKADREAHCNLCLVQVNDQPEPVNSCITKVEDGMIVNTKTEEVIRQRKQALKKILTNHPHACLTCAQKEGCSRTDCSANVPVEERCCKLLGHCLLEKISDYIGIPADIPKYVPENRPKISDDPLFDRDYNLCIGCLRCVRVCHDLKKADILGAVWKDDRYWIGTLKEGGMVQVDCRFCGACVEICPTGALLDKENVPQVQRDQDIPCVGKCPAGIDIPGYLRLIARGRYNDALRIIHSSVPFPGILGYVCFHPCESVCRRGELDQPVAICALKRFVADEITDKELALSEKQPDTGKKIAIIGSGPAGLTAAYYLGINGHQVDIFDNSSQPGGMLRNCIPDYRLPQEVLERELDILNKLGINFRMNSHAGIEFEISDLKNQGYDAVLIAAGTSVSKSLNIEGHNLEGIYPGLDFLRLAKLSKEPRLDGKVVVIGGGNVAVDAGMTAVRLGAAEIQLVCLESLEEIPAHDWEIKQATDEGITILPGWGPEKFISRNNHIAEIELIKCTSVFDRQGRFAPQYDENITKKIPADYVIVTIGQEIDPELYKHIASLSPNTDNPFKISDNFMTGIDGVFAAGDVVSGPSSVVEAIASGKQAAGTIDRYLGGKGLIDLSIDLEGLKSHELDNSDESIKRSKQVVETVDPLKRKSDFCLIENTYDENTARDEAQRCLQCNLRLLLKPDILPPEQWLLFNRDEVESVPETEGVFQLLDTQKKIIRITGTGSLRQGLEECLENPGDARYFIAEQDPMYTKRESELIQQYLQEHGKLPPGNDLEDDLF